MQMWSLVLSIYCSSPFSVTVQRSTHKLPKCNCQTKIDVNCDLKKIVNYLELPFFIYTLFSYCCIWLSVDCSPSSCRSMGTRFSFGASTAGGAGASICRTPSLDKTDFSVFGSTFFGRTNSLWNSLWTCNSKNNNNNNHTELHRLLGELFGCMECSHGDTCGMTRVMQHVWPY